MGVTFTPIAPKIKEVLWQPRVTPWIKCNTNWCSNSNTSSCGGIFRDVEANLILCFVENSSVGNAFHANLSREMKAIEIVSHNNWNHLWLELDSTMFVNNLRFNSQIP